MIYNILIILFFTEKKIWIINRHAFRDIFLQFLQYFNEKLKSNFSSFCWSHLDFFHFFYFVFFCFGMDYYLLLTSKFFFVLYNMKRILFDCFFKVFFMLFAVSQSLIFFIYHYFTGFQDIRCNSLNNFFFFKKFWCIIYREQNITHEIFKWNIKHFFLIFRENDFTKKYAPIL